MAQIPLNDNKFAIVDDEDLERVSRYRWRTHKTNLKSKNPRFVVKTQYREDGKAKSMYLHRFIMNAQKGTELDHINHNTFDNRKENLRFCSRMENCRNFPKRKDGSTQYKGVAKREDNGRYRAYIRVEKKLLHLGHFATALEGARVYNEAAKRYFGEFASINPLPQ